MITLFCGEDADPADKERVSLAGMITSVTTKTTKNGERMAFFTLEDRFAEIECLAFARQYAASSYLIQPDTGVYVSGTLSLREDEAPKLLLNNIEALVENKRFKESDVKPQASEKATTDVKKAPVKQASAPATPPKRLFLRVPSTSDHAYFKALNLCELFEGEFPAFFYFADEKRYERDPLGIALSDYVLRQLKDILGEENVILK